MSGCIPNGNLTVISASRGHMAPCPAGISIGVAAWATDPIGNATVKFSGVAAGSEIRVFLPDGTEVAGIESCAADQILTWQVYSAGSHNNTVRIVIIDMAHKIKEFSYTASIGNQSIPIQEDIDKWYSNP